MEGDFAIEFERAFGRLVLPKPKTFALRTTASNRCTPKHIEAWIFEYVIPVCLIVKCVYGNRVHFKIRPVSIILDKIRLYLSHRIQRCVGKGHKTSVFGEEG